MIKHEKFSYGFFIRLFLFICFALITGYGMAHHELWRDEAHVWVASRDNSFVGVVGEIQYEGTPILWNTILRPFSQLGFPVETMQVIHWVFALVSCALLLFVSPYPLGFIVGILASYYFSYEYAIVARNYVITPVLLFGIAALYKARFEKPFLYGILIFLLFQTNLHSLMHAGTLFFFYMIEVVVLKKISWKTITVICLLLAMSIFTVYTYLSASAYQAVYTGKTFSLKGLVTDTVSFFIPSFNSFSPYVQLPIDIVNVTRLCIVILFLFVILFTYDNIILLFMGALQIAWVLYLTIYAHPGYLRHKGMFLVSLLFILWIAMDARDVRKKYAQIARNIIIVLLGALSLLSVPFSYYVYSSDITSKFSGSKQMAQFIQGTYGTKKTLVTHYSSFGESVYAYLPGVRIYHPEFSQFGYKNVADLRYNEITWNQTLPVENIISDAVLHQGNPEDLVFLFSYPIQNPEKYGLQLVYETSGSFFWEHQPEEYWLYSVAKHM